MKAILNALKVAALFVGTVIGAGFATGRELALYFGNSNAITLLLSAILMGVFCFVFLLYGKKDIKYSAHIGKMVSITLAIAAFFVYSAMLAAAEELIQANFSVPLAGLFLGIISAFLATTIERLKMLNFVLIPFLVGVVIYIATKAEIAPLASSTKPISALAYCAMNMLFVAAIIQKSGKNMQIKHMIIGSVIVSAVMFTLMFLMVKTVIIYKNFSMPFLIAAIRSGNKTIGVTVILIAIFTTMASCNKLIADEIDTFIKKPTISYFIVLSMGLALSIFGFAPLVNGVYPVISVLGVAICALTLIRTLINDKTFEKIKFMLYFYKSKLFTKYK